MKRLISILMTVFLTLSLSSCGSGTDANKNSKKKSIAMDIQDESVSDSSESELDRTPNVTEKSVKISDGPLFVKENNCGFSLLQYSLKTDEFITIFTFYNLLESDGASYEMGYPALENRYFSLHAFDPSFERLAVYWREGSDAEEKHVGWVDRSGKLTDISVICNEEVWGDYSEFEKPLPNYIAPGFDNDGNFVFYSIESGCFVCYTLSEDNLEMSQVWRLGQVKNPMSISTEGIPYDSSLKWTGHSEDPDINYYLDFDGIPHDAAVAKFKDNAYMLQGASRRNGAVICDYFDYEGGYEFFMLKNGVIYRGGPEISPVINNYGYNEYPYWEAYSSDTRVTPSSDWDVSGMVYSNGTIVFTATRGNNYSLFKMPYADGVAGDPELVTEIEDDSLKLYCWSECDDELSVYVNESDE